MAESSFYVKLLQVRELFNLVAQLIAVLDQFFFVLEKYIFIKYLHTSGKGKMSKILRVLREKIADLIFEIEREIYLLY